MKEASVSRSISIVFLRSTSIRYEPVLKKRARVAMKAGLTPTLVYWVRKGSDSATQEGGITYRPLTIPGKYGGGVFSLAERLRFMAKAFAVICEIRPAIIHACDLDMMLLACIYKATQWPGPRLVYDILDFIYDFATRVPNALRMGLRLFDRVLCRMATSILLPDDNRLTMLPPFARGKVTFIYNAPDVSDACTRLEGCPRRTGEPLSIFYAGGFSPDRGLLMLMNAVAARPHKYRLLLAGQGVQAGLAERMAAEHPNIEYVGQIDFCSVVRLTNEADLLYAVYDPSSAVNRVASPNKFFEAVTFGKPIIVANGTSIDEKVRTLDCGWTIDYSESALSTLLDSIEENDILVKGRNAASAALRYGWAAASESLEKLYRSLL